MLLPHHRPPVRPDLLHERIRFLRAAAAAAAAVHHRLHLPDHAAVGPAWHCVDEERPIVRPHQRPGTLSLGEHESETSEEAREMLKESPESASFSGCCKKAQGSMSLAPSASFQEGDERSGK
jgi:hypothetical protein